MCSLDWFCSDIQSVDENVIFWFLVHEFVIGNNTIVTQINILMLILGMEFSFYF